MKRPAAVLIVLSLFAANAAFGFNYRDLRTAPVAWFSDKDLNMMLETFNKAMENNADGTSSEWSNAATGNYGRITPLNTSQEDGNTCRRARVENYAGSNHGVTQLKFCRKNGQKWQVSE